MCLFFCNLSSLSTSSRHICENMCRFVQIRYLGAVGGKDVAETTRRIMRTLMTNAVASRMNFAGRGRKTGIADMKLLSAVIGELLK